MTEMKFVAVFARVGLAKLDAGNLGDGVGFVRRFERTGQERALRDRLRRVLRVNAGAAEEQNFAHAVMMRGADDVVLDLEIARAKIRRDSRCSP